MIILHLLCLLSLSMIKSTYRSESNPPLLWLSFHKLIEVLNVFDRFQWSLIAHHVSQLMRDISTHSRYQHTYYTNKINRNSRAAANRSTHVCTSRWEVCSLSREHRKLNGPISSSSFSLHGFRFVNAHKSEENLEISTSSHDVDNGA